MSKNIKIVVAVIAILGVGVSLSIMGYKFFNKNVTDLPVNDELQENEINSISSLQAEELFKKTLFTNRENEYVMYSAKKLTYEILTETERLQIAYSLMADSKKEQNSNYSEANCDIYNVTKDPSCYKERIKKEDFENVFSSFFGNKVIKYEDFVFNSKSCYLKEEYVYCDDVLMPLSASAYYPIVFLEKSVVQQDKVILIVRSLFYNAASNKLYAAPFEEKEIAILSYEDFRTEDLINKYQKDSGIFEVTFKKDKDEYIWEMTEFVS